MPAGLGMLSTPGPQYLKSPEVAQPLSTATGDVAIEVANSPVRIGGASSSTSSSGEPDGSRAKSPKSSEGSPASSGPPADASAAAHPEAQP